MKVNLSTKYLTGTKHRNTKDQKKKIANRTQALC